MLVPAYGFADQELEVPNNRFVLLKRQNNQSGEAEYAAFKFYKQGVKLDELIVYEWISLHNGEKVVGIENQNFEYGETNQRGQSPFLD